jgi:hypothetical protein
MALQMNLRPFTADESFLTALGTARWNSRSISSKRSDRYEDKQVRNLLHTSNINSFFQSPAFPKDSSMISSVKKLNQVELHSELTKIRARFDKDRKRFSLDDSRYKELQRLTCEKILEEKAGQRAFSTLNNKLETLIKTLNSIERQQADNVQNMQVNHQILDRCKKNRIFLEKKNVRLKNDLKRMNLILEEEKKTQYKERQSKSCSQRVYRMLNRAVDSDRRDKESVVEEVFKDLQIREFLKSKREDRIKRYAEISELEANEAKDKKEGLYRERVLMHKLMATLYSNKLLEMKKKHSNIEEAFLKIRVVTGEYNILELVQKFLTRENTFKDLKYTIEISRKSIEDLNNRNNEIEQIINKATIFDKDSRNVEFYRLKEKYGLMLKDIENSQIKLDYFKAKREHIVEWVKRIVFLLKNEDVNGRLSVKFRNLAKVTVGLLRSLKSL